MQLSSIIPILFIFISNVCASPMYIRSSNNDSIQAISPRTPAKEKTPFPTTMEELQRELGGLMQALGPFEFYGHWGPCNVLKTGRDSYPSYEYNLGYGVGHIPAIIKGIWTTRVPKTRTKEEVIQEVFYLKTWGPDIELLAFFINAHPTPEAKSSPDYLIIIKDKGYLPQQDVAVSTNLRRNAKTAIKGEYKPNAGFLNQQSFLYYEEHAGHLRAVFI